MQRLASYKSTIIINFILSLEDKVSVYSYTYNVMFIVPKLHSKIGEMERIQATTFITRKMLSSSGTYRNVCRASQIARSSHMTMLRPQES